jgi:predicted XRE-type DNA-binding protein
MVMAFKPERICCGMPHWVDPIPALKQRIAAEVLVLTEGWSQTFAASFMQVSQARVSELRRGDLSKLSLERLIQCLSQLGRELEITTVRNGRGRVHPHWKIDGQRFPRRERRR